MSATLSDLRVVSSVREALKGLSNTTSPISSSTCIAEVENIIAREVFAEKVRLAGIEAVHQISDHLLPTVVKFVRSSLNPDALCAATVDPKPIREGFHLLQLFVEGAAGLLLREQAQLLRSCCFDLFLLLYRMNQYHAIQISALGLLLLLVKKCPHMTAAEVDVKKCLEIFLPGAAKTSMAQGVKSLIFQLLGEFCHRFPSEMTPFSLPVLKLFHAALEAFGSKPEVDHTAAEGLLLGLNGFLERFGSDDTIDASGARMFGEGSRGGETYMSDVMGMIFHFLRSALVLAGDTHRYQLPKAALRLLKCNGHLFRAKLFEHASDFLALLTSLCGHKNVELHKQAYPAALVFVQLISFSLCDSSATDASPAMRSRMLQQFLDDMRRLLSTGGRFEVSLAVSAYGLLARPIQLLVNTSELHSLFRELFAHCDALLSRGQEELEEATKHIPQFLSSLACFLIELPEATPADAEIVNSMLHSALLVYPKQYNFKKIRVMVAPAVLKVLVACRRHPALSSISIVFVRRGIALSIASSQMFDLEATEKADDRHIGALYEDYEPLWLDLLSFAVRDESRTLHAWGFPFDATPDLSEASVVREVNQLAEEILLSFSTYSEVLDVSCRTTGDVNISGPSLPQEAVHHAKFLAGGGAVAPRSPKDYALFLNLAAAFTRWIPRLLADEKMIGKWGPLLISQFVELSAKNGHVSGFYTMLTALVRHLKSRDFFGTDHVNDAPRSGQCDELLRFFAQSTLHRLSEYTHELLAAAVICLLELPPSVSSVATLLPAISTALQLSTEYEPAATAALSALELWMQTQRATFCSEILPAVLPKLQCFFDGLDKKTDVHHRLLSIVGSHGIRVASILETQQHSTRRPIAASIDEHPRIVIKLPFRDCTIDFNFDSLLPRILQVALESKERKPRVAACELLHALVEWMIGTTAYRQRLVAAATSADPQGQEAPTAPAPLFTRIFRTVLPVVLKLSVANDVTVRQLFGPFLLQITRWFAQGSVHGEKDICALLDTLVAGIASTSAAVRNAGVEALAEFQHWSIRHRGIASTNLRGMYRRIIALLHHPSMWHRLGGAIAVNRLSRDFRDVLELVHEHALSLCYHVLCALRTSADDDPSSGVIAQLKEALAHLEKIIVFRSSILAEPHLLRSGERFAKLSELVEWLFEQCGCVETDSRHVAMRLFTTFCSCLPGFESDDGPKRWLVKKRQLHGMGFFHGIFHGFSIDQPEKVLTASLSLHRFVSWSCEIEASAECHAWLLGCNLLSPYVAFGRRPVEERESKRRRVEPPPSPANSPCHPTSVKTGSGESKLLLHIFYFIVHCLRGHALRNVPHSQMVWFEPEGAIIEMAWTPQERSLLLQRKIQTLTVIASLVHMICSHFPGCCWGTSDEEVAKGKVAPILDANFYEIAVKLLLKPAALMGPSVHAPNFLEACVSAGGRLLEALWNELVRSTAHESERELLVRVVARSFPFNPLDISAVRVALADGTRDTVIASRGLARLRAIGVLLPALQRAQCTTKPLNASEVAQSMLRLLFTLALEQTHGPCDSEAPEACPMDGPFVMPALRELATLMFDLNPSSSALMEVLLDDSQLIQPPPLPLRRSTSSLYGDTVHPTARGAVFLGAFRSEIDAFVVDHVKEMILSLVERLASSSSSPAQQFVVHELFVMLCSRISRSTSEAQSIVEHITAAFPTLHRAASSGSKEHRCIAAELEFLASIEKVLLQANPVLLLHSNAQQVCTDAVELLGCRQRYFTSHTLLRSSRHGATFAAGAAVAAALLRVPGAMSSSTFNAFVGDLEHSLTTLFVDEFPVRPEELVEGSTSRDTHVEILHSLLVLVEALVHCPHLLFKLLPIFRFNDTSFSRQLDHATTNLLKALPPKGLAGFCSQCLVIRPESIPLDLWDPFLNRDLLPALFRLPPEEIEKLFAASISQLVTTVEQVSFGETSDSANFHCVHRIVSFRLLEAMYRRCSPLALKGSINNAFVGRTGPSPPTGRELTERLTKACLTAKAQAALGFTSPPDPKTLLHYRQAAYACLVALIIATQRQEKFFVQFLLREKGTDLWHSIVDLSVQFQFTVETNFEEVQKIAERQGRPLRDVPFQCSHDRSATDPDAHKRRGIQQVKYLSTQYLQETHLSEPAPGSSTPSETELGPDVSTRNVPASPSMTPGGGSLAAYKLNLVSSLQHRGAAEAAATTVDPPDRESSRAKSPASLASSDAFASHSFPDRPELTMPVDDDRAHPIEADNIWKSCCFEELLMLVDHMAHHFSDELSQHGDSWLKEFLSVLRRTDAHFNVRLAIVKLVLLRWHIFERYASELFVPMVDVATNPTIGAGLHYFLRDVCICFLKWRVPLPPNTIDGERATQRLITHLTRNLPHLHRHIFHENIELLKCFVEQWMGRARVHVRDLLSWLCYSESHRSAHGARMCGVQICGVLAANGLVLYNSVTDSTVISEEDFYKKLAANLEFGAKDVYCACAEVFGMVLRNMFDAGASPTPPSYSQTSGSIAREIVCAKLSLLFQNDHHKFLAILARIAQHYPPIVDDFLPGYVFAQWGRLPVAQQGEVLRMLALRSDKLMAMYHTLHSHVAPVYPAFGEEQQLALFFLFRQAGPYWNREQLEHLASQWLPSIAERNLHTMGLKPRLAFFALAIHLFDNCAPEAISAVRPSLASLIELGFHDSDAPIQDLVLRFWDNEERMTTDVIPRFHALHTQLHPARLGDAWVQYSSILLLYLLHRMPDFSRTDVLFPHPISTCVFKVRNLDTSWSPTVPLTPMFSSQAQVPVSRLATMPASVGGIAIAAREDVGPSANRPVYQAPVVLASQAKSGMAPSTTAAGTLVPFDESITPSMLPSSMYFSASVPTSATPSVDGSSSAGAARSRLRHRFPLVPEQFQIRRHIIHSARLRQLRDAQDAEERERHSNRIAVFRSYREGEVPDVQISFHALIVPLQALCLYDGQIALSTLCILSDAFAAKINAACSQTPHSASTSTGPRHALTAGQGGSPFSLFGDPAVGPQTDAPNMKAMRSGITNAINSMLAAENVVPEKTFSGHTNWSTKRLVEFAFESLLSGGTPSEELRAEHLCQLGPQNDHHIPSAILAIERCLTCRNFGDPSAASGADTSGAQRLCWARLLQLYRQLGDLDTAIEIGTKCMRDPPLFRKIIESIRHGDGEVAARGAEHSLRILGSSPQSEASAFDDRSTSLSRQAEESILRHEMRIAHASLLNWGAVVASFESVEAEEAILHSIHRQQGAHDIVPYVQAKMKQSISSVTSMLQQIHQDHALFSALCVERALADLAVSNLFAAEESAVAGMRRYAGEWGALGAELIRRSQFLYSAFQCSQLLRLHREPEKILQTFHSTVSEWRTCFDETTLQPAASWDDLFFVYQQLLGKLSTHAGTLAGEVSTTAIQNFSEVTRKFEQEVCLAAGRSLTGSEATNDTAKMFLERYLLNQPSDRFDMIAWEAVVNNTIYRAQQRQTGAPLLKSFQEIRSHIKARGAKWKLTEGTWRGRFERLQGDCWAAQTERLLETDGLLKFQSETLSGAHSAISHLETAIGLLDEQTPSQRGLKELEATILRLVAFTSNVITHAEVNKAAGQLEESAALGSSRHTLQLIERFQSREARELLPRVLHLASKYTPVADVLAQHASTLSPWSVLPWTAQLLSALLTPAAAAVGPLLRRVAVHYPQVVFYPFSCLQQELYRAAEKSNAVRETVESIEEQTKKNPMLQQFADALHTLHHPELRFRTHWEEIKHVLQLVKAAPSEREKNVLSQRATAIWEQCQGDCLDSSAPGIGEYNRKFARDWSSKIRHALCNATTGKLNDDYDTFRASSVALLEVMRLPPVNEDFVRLASFSEFLAQLHVSSFHARCIELPVQPFRYLDSAGHIEPPKIISVDPLIRVMPSVQRPKRIVFYTSDEREHAFLVKGGDDLRLDQRIQQLFHCINNALRDERDSHSFLHIRTMSVVPLSRRVGLIQWVPDTEPMKSAIERSMFSDSSLQGRRPSVANHRASEQYLQFVLDLATAGDASTPRPSRGIQPRDFLLLFKHVSNARGEHSERVEGWIRQIRSDYLRRALMDYGTLRREYFQIRKNFTETCAAASIASYVLGIGDRHLENFLLDRKSGDVIFIDFGHAFGTATTTLAIPELIPFRLTPQMVHVLGPLGTQRIAAPMSRALESIRKARSLLMGLLGTFLNEPLVAWEHDASGRSTEAIARQKLSIVSRKMALDNPVDVMMDEVRQNSNIVCGYCGNVADEVTDVLRGQPIPRPSSQRLPSATEQVGVLIEMAVDRNILGRTWGGWYPFF